MGGYRGRTVEMPLNESGFQFPRNVDDVIPAVLVDPSRNLNYHERGLGRRGGSTIAIGPITAAPRMMGGYDFRKSDGTQFKLFATAAGKVYRDSESNLLKSGMSTSKFFHFSQLGDLAFIADGDSKPQYWDGVTASTTDCLTPTSWGGASDWPFMIIPHSRGANRRNWAITCDAVWASKNGDGKDFSDGQVRQIPVYSVGGLVGGADFGGTLFVWSKTKGYIIDDTDPDVNLWGYHEVQWDGGLANFRLVILASNNLFLMNEDGTVYSLRGITATGSYESASLTRPAYIDRWIQQNVNISNIENFHASFDRKLRAIKFFLQASGSQNNKSLVFFIDRRPEIAWSLHDNDAYPSGYDASCSFEVRNAAGDFQIWTGDYSGRIWKLEQSGRNDNGNPYASSMKIRPQDFGNKRMWKHFKACRLRTAASGNFNLTARIWIDSTRRPDAALAQSGSGAVFDTAVFDTAVFAGDALIPIKFDVLGYGFEIQVEIYNSNANEDFFHSTLIFEFLEMGVRP